MKFFEEFVANSRKYSVSAVCQMSLNRRAHPDVKGGELYFLQCIGFLSPSIGPTSLMLLSKHQKRSLTIAGRKTSLRLEPLFWTCLREIAEERQCTVSELIAQIQDANHRNNLSSAIRVFIVEYFRKKPLATNRST